METQALASDDPVDAVRSINFVSPELARASLSLDLGEPADFSTGVAAPGTNFLLANVEEASKRAVNADYAEGWLLHRERVSAEYSFNFVPNRSLFAVLVDGEGVPFVNYTLELDPELFALEGDESGTKFYTTVDINMEIRDPEGRLVLSRDKASHLELNQAQLEQDRECNEQERLSRGASHLERNAQEGQDRLAHVGRKLR